MRIAPQPCAIGRSQRSARSAEVAANPAANRRCFSELMPANSCRQFSRDLTKLCYRSGETLAEVLMTAIARASEFALPSASARSQASSFTVEAIRDLGAAEAIWRELEAVGTSSPYQRFDWQKAYVEALAESRGFERCVLLVRDGDSRPCLLIPLAIERRPGLRRGRDRRQARELPPAAHGRGRGAALAVRAPHPAAAGRPPARHRRLCLHEPAAVLARARQSPRLRRTAEPQQRLPPHPRRERRGGPGTRPEQGRAQEASSEGQEAARARSGGPPSSADIRRDRADPFGVPGPET